ncbi:hypothetical protein PG985_011191 [Apiospora marii]|uniref:Uncharacterized protein n=1 Tax=Apiospora marii TaxID=335849 RepID=A0ABR1SUD0_9PEZI
MGFVGRVAKMVAVPTHRHEGRWKAPPKQQLLIQRKKVIPSSSAYIGTNSIFDDLAVAVTVNPGRVHQADRPRMMPGNVNRSHH